MDQIAARIDELEAALNQQIQSTRTDQKLLELETAEQIVNRLKERAKTYGFFVGIPVAVVLLGLALMTGKSFKDLYDLASSSRQTIEPLLDKARFEADTAKTTAAQALRTSQEVKGVIGSTESNVAKLRDVVDKRVRETDQLASVIRIAQSQVSLLEQQVAQQSSQVQQLRLKFETVRTDKNVQSVRDVYPFLSADHVVGGRNGYFDSSQKKAGDIYVNLVIYGEPQSLTDRMVSKIVGLLQDQGCKVFLGEVDLYARSERSSQGLFGTGGMACELAGIQRPPCLLYFRDQLRNRGLKIRDAASLAQSIPDDKLRYVATDKLKPIQREFFEKSGLDFLIVLDGG